MEFPNKIFIAPRSYGLIGKPRYIKLMTSSEKSALYEDGFIMLENGELKNITYKGLSILVDWYNSETEYQISQKIKEEVKQ